MLFLLLHHLFLTTFTVFRWFTEFLSKAFSNQLLVSLTLLKKWMSTDNCTFSLIFEPVSTL